MAVAIMSTNLPEGIGEEVYPHVVAEVKLGDEPPEGLIFHWAGEIDGRFTVTELWSTREANQRFLAARLFPAIRKLSGREPRESTRFAALSSAHCGMER